VGAKSYGEKEAFIENKRQLILRRFLKSEIPPPIKIKKKANKKRKALLKRVLSIIRRKKALVKNQEREGVKTL